jgi:hypothetical protein
VTIAAHLIVGARPEPFLPALLVSLEGVADRLIVNDNSGDPEGPNARALAASSFARRGALIVDTAPFVDFANARNRVLDLHRKHGAGAWAAFVDADEIHRPAARTIARNLAALPPSIASVDGYTRHYVRSLEWYMSIERRMSFFRVTPELRWERPVHEKLAGMRGTTLIVPYVYEHYGWVTPMRQLAAKGRQYAGLGQDGATFDDEEVDAIDRRAFFAPYFRDALHYGGAPPPALGAIRADLERELGAMFADADAAIRALQTPRVRLRNALRRFTFAYRWRGRLLDARARRLLRGANANER